MNTPQTQERVFTHTIEGRVVGEYTSTEGATPRQFAVIMTLSGPELAPRDMRLPLDTNDVIESLAQRIEDVIEAAARVGYQPEAIRGAVARALTRQAPVLADAQRDLEADTSATDDSAEAS